MKRVFNFNPGPSTLPLDVLKIVQEELLDYRATGMSVMEISHRSPEFGKINKTVIALGKKLLGLSDDYHVLFVGGGASSQFAHIPINFLPNGKIGVYVDTGTWSTKAIKEAKKIGEVLVAASSESSNYNFIPDPCRLQIPKNAAYLHITTNNTIKGTQYHTFPEIGNVPLIADMSSDILSRQMDYSQFAMFYAGAQKNLGPSGVTMVVIKNKMLEHCAENLPTMMDYRTHASTKSLFNTPPAFGIYMVKLVLEWIEKQGGIAAVEENNRRKKDAIYNLIDAYPNYFKGTANKDNRSWMNITLRLPSVKLEEQLIAEGETAGFVGLKGHRSIGGIRVSLYNAMTLDGAQKIAEFMNNFRKAN